MTRRSVELRNVSAANDLRRLTASIDRDGNLVIEGLDAGDEVERIFGFREYEWIWTIRAHHVPRLLRALDASSDALSALNERFGGDRGGGRLVDQSLAATPLKQPEIGLRRRTLFTIHTPPEQQPREVAKTILAPSGDHEDFVMGFASRARTR